MSTMDLLWDAKGRLSIREIERDIFLFSFGKEADRARVLDWEPWIFNKALLVLRKVEGNEVPRWTHWSKT